ncbi:hypothetical protein KSS87_007960 [Heliosperma pusillum]|nr:hypothetical protein KSS87_007960 [Heliosperma pusillum]
MTSSSDHQPGFMQPLLPNFLTSFSIPKAYLKRLEVEFKGDSLETVVLMSQSEPRRHWLVAVERGRHFTHGWKEFCLHLGFQVGDFVVFHYRSHLLFLVSLFDPVSACQRISPSPWPFLQDSKTNQVDFNSTHKTETTENHAAAIPPKEHHFSCLVKLTTYNVKNSIIYLPVGFARESGLQRRSCQVTVIDAKGRVWPVTMNYKKIDGQVYIKGGWKQFLSANRLKVGYHLSIHLIKAGTCPTLKCFRANREGAESSPPCETTPKETQAEDFTARPSEQDLSHYPSCHIYLSSCAMKRSVIYLPRHFVRDSGLQSQKYKVKVVDEEERTWQASLSFKKGTANAYLCGGWKNVVAANSFMHGDVICFQLLEAGEYPLLRCYSKFQYLQILTTTLEESEKESMTSDIGDMSICSTTLSWCNKDVKEGYRTCNELISFAY